MSDGGDLEENGHFQERKCIAPECFSSMGGDLEENANGHFKEKKCIAPECFSSMGAILKKMVIFSRGNA